MSWPEETGSVCQVDLQGSDGLPVRVWKLPPLAGQACSPPAHIHDVRQMEDLQIGEVRRSKESACWADHLPLGKRWDAYATCSDHPILFLLSLKTLRPLVTEFAGEIIVGVLGLGVGRWRNQACLQHTSIVSPKARAFPWIQESDTHISIAF